MDPISNVDRLVLLLRQRLQEQEARRRTTRGGRKEAKTVGTAQALAAVENIDERQLRRALIQGLLSDHFGQHLINEARFQQMVDRVVSAIENDEAGKALLDRVTDELRAQTR